MKIYSSNTELSQFLYFLSQRKQEYANRSFLHVKINKNYRQLKIAEVVQSITQYFQNKDAAMITFDLENDLIVTTPNNDNLAMPLFEKAIYETFSRESVFLSDGSFNEQGIRTFSKIVLPHIPFKDWPSFIELQRASRMANCIMVMDDDPMVLRQMEQALVGFGTVVTVQDTDQFFDLYKKHAPDILFLDIHMPSAKGTNLLEELVTTIDPHAHVIMISSDTMKNTVLETKAKGTKGFIVKPLTRENVYAHILRAPTFLPKQAIKSTF